MPRFGGPATMMRLPSRDNAQGLDVAFSGVPLIAGVREQLGSRPAYRQ